MQKHMNNLLFRLMALEYRIKKAFPHEVLAEAGVHAGMTVLDFGCGPGRFTIPAAGIVGAEGRVHALDVHPLAIRLTERKARRAGLANISLVRSDCATGLPPGSVDAALLYDTLHDMEDKDAILGELHRVLKAGGKLSYRDHTFRGDPLLSLMGVNGFRLSKQAATEMLFVKC